MCWTNCASKSTSGRRSEDRAGCPLFAVPARGGSLSPEKLSAVFVVLDGAIPHIFSWIALACTTAPPLSCCVDLPCAGKVV